MLLTTTMRPLIEIKSLALPWAERSLDWALPDAAAQYWAIVASASSPAPNAVKKQLLHAIAHPHAARAGPVQHAPLLKAPGAIRTLVLTSRISSSSMGGGGGAAGFVDYSARYGAIRDTEATTLFESIMDSHGVQTGAVARRAFMPDPLLPPSDAATAASTASSSSHLLKRAPSQHEVRRALALQEQIHSLGPRLGITQQLLQRPLIALSNGQLTRAKIISALLPAAVNLHEDEDPASQRRRRLELLLLDLPYSGLDPPSREQLTQLLSALHAKQAPRIVLGLREGDPLPPTLVSDVLWIRDGASSSSRSTRRQGDEVNGHDDGATPPSVQISSMSRDEFEEEMRRVQHRTLSSRHSLSNDLPEPYTAAQASTSTSLSNLASLPPSPPGSVDQIRANAKAGVGVGSSAEKPYVEMRNVSVQYKGFHALKGIDLTLTPGTRLILAGPNGSGKTTLLALLLGDHPLSFSFPGVDEQAKAHPTAAAAGRGRAGGGKDEAGGALSLFGHPRTAQSNASPFLAKRIGHTSPELFRAFPRQADLERGGLSVAQAIASGFEGVFVRTRLEGADAGAGGREGRVRELVRAFGDLFSSHPGPRASRVTPTTTNPTGTAPSLQSQTTTLTEPDLTNLLHHTPFAALSPGSQALALLLRAVVHEPDVLILDEPFAGMDEAQIARARLFLDGVLWAREGAKEKAMVLISHYEHEWPASFGRLVRLDEGAVVERI